MNSLSDQKRYQYDLFISYTDADRDWVKSFLRPALGLPDEHVITRQDFRLGTPIVAEFERAIRDSRYTVLILSPDYLVNDWATFGEQLATYASVTEQRDRLIPLVLRPSKLPLRIEFRVRLDYTEQANWESETARLRTLLNQPEPAPEYIPCPYPGGMAPFSEKNAGYFFGRQSEIDELWRLLRYQNFLFVIGPSGSGKSSLVFAGLLPRVDKQQGEWFIPKPIRPGATPLATLAHALNIPIPTQSEKWQQGVEVTLTQHQPARRLLLIIDQFEELFTQSSPQDQASFISALRSLRQLSSCVLVSTMRADFYEELMSSDLWPIAPVQRLEIVPLHGTALRDAIAKPAEAVGVYVEAVLLERLLTDAANEPGVLPLLQETMVQLWEDRQYRLVPLSAYERLGREGRSGLAVAIARMADARIANLSANQEMIARRIFLRLVQFGEGRANTRRQQSIAELRSADDEPGLFDETLRYLTDSRLVTLSGEEDGIDKKVDIAHEALITGWPALQTWLNDWRRDEQVRRRLEVKAEEWSERVQQGLGGGLLDESELAEAESWIARHDSDLGYSIDLRRLVQASRTAIEIAEHEKEKQRTAIALREQAAKVMNSLLVQPLEGLVQAIQLMGLNLTIMPEELLGSIQASLHGAVEVARERSIFLGHTASVLSVAFSPDGQTIVSGSDDKTLRLWDRQSTSIGAPFRGHEASVLSVAFSPDGQTIVSGSADGTVRLWDRQGSPIGAPFQGHEASILSVAFSPDGQTIVSGSDDKTLRLWDRQGIAIGPPFQGHEAYVLSVAFSLDGQTIVSGSADGTVRLWDRQGTSIGGPFRGHEASVRSVAFSPDGQTIVSGSDDKTLRLWDRQGSSIGAPFRGHEAYVLSVAFSPDGQTIVSGSADRTLRLWDRQGTPIGYPFRGHGTEVRSVTFSPDGQAIVSGGNDRTLRLWDRQGTSIGAPFRGHEADVNSVALSPDGQTIVSGSADGTVRLWDRQGSPIGGPFRGHEAYVRSVAFSPDGQTIVSGGNDRTLRLWDRQGSPIGGPFRGHEAPARSVAFSPDGQTIVSGSDDKTLRLWDRQGTPIGYPFRGHGAPVWSVAFSPDGQTIVSGSADGTVRLWDRQGSPIGAPFRGHEASVWSVTFSPDGQTIVSGSADGTVRLWDRQGSPIGAPFRGHEAEVWSVAFSPDGQSIVSGSGDRTLRLWDRQGTPIGYPFRGHGAPVWSVAFSPDGQTIVSGSGDRTLRLWRGGNWEAWLQVACNRLRCHPVFANLENDANRAACETCQKYVWNRKSKTVDIALK